MFYKLLLLFLLYIPFQLAFNASEGFDLASGRVFVLLLVIIWLLKSLAQKKLFLPNKIQTLLLLSFLFLSAFSFVFAQNTEWAYRKLLFLLSFIPLYFIVADIAQDKERVKRIIEFLVYGAGLISLVGIFQFILQFLVGINETLKFWQKVITPFLGNSFSESVFQYSSWLVAVSGNTYMRAIAFFPDPHIFSFYLGMLLPFSIALCLKYKPTKKVFFYLFLFISASILVSDILTFSRGGYLGLLAGLIFVLFAFRNKIIGSFSLKKFIAINIFILIVASAIILPNPASNRLVSSFDAGEGSNAGRFENWNQSLEVIKNNPLGVGIGNYSLEIKPSADYREPIYSHDLYLDIAAETGIINALIFIWLIIASVFGFTKLGKTNKFWMAGAVSLAIFSIHSIFETPLYSVHTFPLFLIIVALSTIENE